MAKSLVIVESPAKARTIKKYLGKGFEVLASVGHIKDLPKSELGVDVEHDFAPKYVAIRGKGKILSGIKKAAKSADQIYLAPDPDREGEAIAWHIAEEIRQEDKVFRILFNEITKRGVSEAIAHPQKLNKDKFEAQQARRILDRLVGYQISPILWDKVRRGLSAGRVQSVALRLICEREKEILAFKPQEYWSVTVELEGNTPPPFEAKLVRIDGEKANLTSESETKKLTGSIDGADYLVEAVTKKSRKKNPPPPFITSTLQQEAARKLGFSAKKTMMLAQRLYEGVDFGTEGPVGLITYMRTDSTRVANEAMTEVRDHISSKYGKEYLPPSPRTFKSAKSAQEAHEAIRPTSMEYHPGKAAAYLEKDQIRLYELIWNRFVASQMNPAIMDQTSIDIRAGSATFRATGSIIRFDGYMSLYTEGKDDETEEEKEGRLPDLNKGEKLTLLKLLPRQHFTEPPPRFREASLVRELEEKGIGRPSTYAAIISNLQDREYVRLDKRVFFPTELGMLISDLLISNFPDIMNVEFTARMEQKLDEIEEGKEEWVQAMKQFYSHFSTALEFAREKMRDIKREEIPTEIRCDKCGSNMVIKWGRMGEFLACPNYPDCKNTTNFKRDEGGKILVVEEELELTEENCEKCGKPMALRTGKFGRFLACSDYPDCKTTKPFSTGVKCNACGKGDLVERRSKKGKVFYSCSEYPRCTFATWDRPIPEPCPLCEAPFLVEGHTKKEGTVIKCIAEGCSYKKTMKED